MTEQREAAWRALRQACIAYLKHDTPDEAYRLRAAATAYLDAYHADLHQPDLFGSAP